MFTQKKKTLFVAKKQVKTQTNNEQNMFLSGLNKQAAETLSGNLALKYSTTGSDWIDAFGKLGLYKIPRDFNEIAKDCVLLYSQDKELFVKFTIYMRMISRKTNIIGLGKTTESPQSGAELKHEATMRMVWLCVNDPQAFWNNICLFLSAGSVKDIFVMLKQDLMFHGWENRKLDWNKFGDLILELLKDNGTSELMKKYLPQIKSNSSCKTVESQASNLIAKWICSLLFGNKEGESGSTYKKYRQLKNSGTAHQWQQLISQKKFSDIDFGKIHGRALSKLVKSKFLKNQSLSDKYATWISGQTSVKCTGYVHEILCELETNREKNFVDTVDKQFVELVNKVKDSDDNLTSLIVVRDTSGSMSSIANGTKFSCYDIGKALALYFSEFLSGAFANHWIEFNSDARLHQWKGKTASQKWFNDHSSYVGSTNFQSVIKLFCDMKKSGVSEEQFPKGILCISDSEFNLSSLNETNVTSARKALVNAGFSQEYVDSFKIILWNLQSNYYGSGTGCKFEAYGDIKNVFHMSGYSASNVKFILNQKVETAQDLFNTAMNQELLELVTV